ncbi:MAG: site-specific DNA-methyltransferase [Bacteroidales bacterium]|nr:site-specific DNA-methyltransferase [Bacteroidales bacterium]
MLSEVQHNSLLDSLQDSTSIKGLTHNYYNYPARFSPLFAKSVIETFSSPGDTVLDPFMGGGTSLVEAFVAGRRSAGNDINQLSFFLSKVKTTLIKDEDLYFIINFIKEKTDKLKIYDSVVYDDFWVDHGYHRNLNTKESWRIRKTIAQLINFSAEIKDSKLNGFYRCILLKSAQWALDNNLKIPNVEQFKEKLLSSSYEMAEGMKQLYNRVIEKEYYTPTLLYGSADNINKKIIDEFVPFKLIVTSPPYPGVHMLYHRWQIRGRKETSAPYWISSTEDGHGEAYYTLGSRSQKGHENYYNLLFRTYKSLSEIIDRNTVVAQLVAFSQPNWQLSRFLEVMEAAGYKEIILRDSSKKDDGRIWREVPHRKWYISQKASLNTAKEVLLLHTLRNI